VGAGRGFSGKSEVKDLKSESWDGKNVLLSGPLSSVPLPAPPGEKKAVPRLRKDLGRKVSTTKVLRKNLISFFLLFFQTSKKKWTERVENVEKQKELRVKKRTTNIQSRKDDKKKKQKKLQRKKGRIL